MASNVPVPYFPTPPNDYNRNYMDQLVRAFAVFAQQVNNPGPIRATTLTLNPSGEKIDSGELSYSTEEDTFALTHLNGVIQHIGFDTFMRCRNNTGSTIPKGRVVGFSGVSGDILVSQYLADGTIPELYFVGVTAFDMADQAVGGVYVYGKLDGIDTTGTPVGEAWAVGDILYASATTAGRFTKVRPTAPNTVISVAAVLTVGATTGSIMIRPLIPMGLDYGTFVSNTDQTVATINTATPVTYTSTEISNGVTLGTPVSRIVVSQAGYYHVAISAQVSSANASSKNIFIWLDKNGANVTDTTRAITLSGNGTYLPFSAVYDISLQANDYIRVMWAASDTNVALDAFVASGFAPSGPAITVTVTQMQL
jgi:effector-binding domain-containing protein